MIDLKIINPIEFKDWDSLVLSHPEATFFHSSSWARVLHETYGYTPLYFTVLSSGRISGLIPVMEVRSAFTGKRGVSLPFTDYCDPIADENIRFQDLLDSVIDYGKRSGWRFLDLRGGVKSRESQVASGKGFSQSSVLSPQSSSLTPSVSYLGHVIDLYENEEEMFYGFKDSTRRSIRKANREAVEVGIFDTLESVKEFCRLNGLTRREHGLPPQPYSFFKNLYEQVISKNLGLIVLASHQGKNIAGAVFLHFGQKAFYKYGASDRRDQHLRANNLVMWGGIKWYARNGYKSLHLGRTEPENGGLLQFKSGWRPTEHPIHYYRYDLRKDVFVSGSPRVTGFHNRIFRNIPIPVLNRIGAFFYRHAG